MRPHASGETGGPPGELPMRFLLVAAGEEGERWAAAVAAEGLDARASRAGGPAEVPGALRDPLDLVLAWDDDAGERARAVVETVRDAGAEVPVAVVPHPGAEGGAARALAAGAVGALERGRPERLPAELRRVLREQELVARAHLTGRIAHDLNNLLAPIPLAVQLLRRSQVPTGARGPLDSVDTATRRSMAMVKELSELLSTAPGTALRVRAKHLLAIAARRWRHPGGEVTGVLTDYQPDLGSVRVDLVRFLQLLWCLARRAVDGAGGGELLFQALSVAAEPPAQGPGLELRVLCSASPGRASLAEGGGARPADPADGLEAAREMVEAHGGTLGVLAGDGERTGYSIRLAAASGLGERSPAPRPPREAAAPDPPSGGGSERSSGETAPRSVLVIEADEEVRRMTRETLESFGFEVFTAADGTEGVAVYAERVGEVGAVLVDMSLPYMDGPATIRALRRIGEQVPMILTTGGEVEARRPGSAPDGPDAVLRKPYDAESLLRALRGRR